MFPHRRWEAAATYNNIFILIIGIHATSRIKLSFLTSRFAAVTKKGILYDSMDYLSD